MENTMVNTSFPTAITKEFLKIQETTNIFGTAIEQIDRLTEGNYEEKYPLTVKTEGEKAILDAIEKLRQSLRLLNDRQTRCYFKGG